MPAVRKIAPWVNGLRVTKARVHRGENVPELVITNSLPGDFAIYDSSKVELLELLFPPEVRQRLPNGGWRKVSLRILIRLLRRGLARMAEES